MELFDAHCHLQGHALRLHPIGDVPIDAAPSRQTAVGTQDGLETGLQHHLMPILVQRQVLQVGRSLQLGDM